MKTCFCETTKFGLRSGFLIEETDVGLTVVKTVIGEHCLPEPILPEHVGQYLIIGWNKKMNTTAYKIARELPPNPWERGR